MLGDNLNIIVSAWVDILRFGWDNMAIERKWEAVSQNFTGDGNQDGLIPVANASGFFAKQRAVLTSNTQQKLIIEVRRVTATTIQVGLPGSPFTTYTDVSAYTLADAANIRADEQDKPILKPDEIWQAIYQRDPAVALRELLVNKFGVPIDTVVDGDGNTRLAVDANITIDNITVDIDALTPPDQEDPDNILIAGSEDGTKEGMKHAVRVDEKGLLLTINKSNLVPEERDDLVFTRDPDSQSITQIEYKFESATVATVIIERDANLSISRIYRA